MDKNVKAGLIIVGVLVGLLAVAFIAQAAGLTGNYASMPYRQMMSGNSMIGGGMMRMMAGGMMGGQSMMDPNTMPHRNWTSEDGQAPWENCPYFDQAQ